MHEGHSFLLCTPAGAHDGGGVPLMKRDNLLPCVISLDALKEKIHEPRHTARNRIAQQKNVGGPHVLVEIAVLRASESTRKSVKKCLARGPGLDRTALGGGGVVRSGAKAARTPLPP